MKKNVLIGDISSYKAIVICEFISKNYPDINLFTFDTKRFTRKIRTKYSANHFYINSERLEEQIKSIIFDYKIDLFLPVINEKLNTFWEYKQNYGNSLSYLGDFSTYQILNKKNKLHKLAVSLGINVPQIYDSIKNAVMPYVVKPTNLSSAKGVFYVTKEDEIPKLANNKDLIIQQYIDGVGVGYSFYCKDGKILSGYGHRRLAEYPVTGGSSTYREGYKNNKMIEIASKIVDHLKYTGFAMFEYKLTPEDDIYLIEVNPRIWGSVNQGMANGTNYFEGVLGKAKNTIKVKKKEVKTYLSPLVYMSFIKYLLSFQFEPIIYFVKNIFRNSPDVSIIRDPKGYLSIILRRL